MAVKKATTTRDIVEVEPKADDAKAVRVKSPMGAVTEVPASIVEALLKSGYSKIK